MSTLREDELLVDLQTGALSSVEPERLIGVGPPEGMALLSSLTKMDLVVLLQDSHARASA
jgi:hypothetical protein